MKTFMHYQLCITSAIVTPASILHDQSPTPGRLFWWLFELWEDTRIQRLRDNARRLLEKDRNAVYFGDLTRQRQAEPCHALNSFMQSTHNASLLLSFSLRHGFLVG